MCERQNFYVGTYTEPILFGTGEIFIGKGEGIYQISLDRKKKKLYMTGKITNSANPSFLAVSKNGKMLFAVNELKKFAGEACGSVSSFQIMKDGSLKLLDVKPTHGQDPCHVKVVNEKTLIVSNFMTGSICSYRILENGTLEEASFVQHEGNSVDESRQRGPHAHSCISVPGTNRVIIPDLGTDKLIVYEVAADSTLCQIEQETFNCPPGSGPRYGEFHPKNGLLYVINELASSILVLKFDKIHEKYICMQSITTFEGTEDNICADLHISKDGRFLYASNRGHDSISLFEIGSDGLLTRTDDVSCGGEVPRNFCIDEEGKFILVGNQNSDVIVLFEVNAVNGHLAERDRLEIGSPVCLCPY